MEGKMNFDALFTERALRVKSSIIRELLKLGSQPGIISLGGGLPDPNLFPFENFKECMDVALTEHYKISLQYGETAGYMPLRQELVTLSKADGIENIDVDNIIVTTASQQAIDFMAKLFVDKDDVIITEAPTYLSAIQSFQTFMGKFEIVNMDKDGAIIDELESILIRLASKGIKPKFFYTIPTFQNPAGVCMSLARRKQLISLAEKYELLIIEDNPYGDLRYDGEALPPLKALDKNDQVIYLRTFSKILAPGIRLGWVVGPKSIMGKLSLMKQATDLCTPVITQVAVNEYLKRNYLWPHLQTIKASYANKCKTMVQAVQKYFPEEMEVNIPQGGMFLWASAPKHVDVTEMFKEAIEKGVAYIMGSAFYPNGEGNNTMRLNFTMQTPENITEGIRRLGEMLKAKI
jgi:2-aminoadipate transaminase